MNSVINFCSVGDDFGWMSNFAPYPIVIAARRWPTSEHYFQAQKFNDAAVQDKVRIAKSPMEGARLGEIENSGCERTGNRSKSL